MRPERARLLERGVIAALVAAGIALRADGFDALPLSTDEAESALNALTILDRGVPADRYAGQPMFENTLLRPWPESPEYEFRDLSYSERGLAVYHGWLPLYAMAASFAAAGVEPDPAPAPGAPMRPRHDARQAALRTAAARAPSILFAAGFLLAAWFTGRALLGRDAALAALALAAFAGPCVRVARQARYYSATLLLSTLCCLALWRLGQRGRYRDAALAALALTLLFHTHAITFAGACVVAGVWLPLRLRGRGAAGPLLLLGGLTAAGVGPWLALTGALEALGEAPAARTLLRFPDDALDYLSGHRGAAALLVGASAALAGATVLRSTGLRLTLGRSALARPCARLLRPTALLVLWSLAAPATFLALVPAPSCFLWRLTLGLQGPGVVLTSLLLCAGARALGARSVVGRAAPGLLVALLALAAYLERPAPRPAPPWSDGEPVHAAVAHLRALDLPPGARLYATPDQHLPLTLYTGLPVQSIAPVRGAFLDAYPGEIVLVDACAPSRPVAASLLAEEAGRDGVELDQHLARAWSTRLATRLLREDLARRVASVTPPLEPLPAFVARAVARARALEPREGDGRWQNPAVFRGHEAHDRRAFWQVFFYRFVGPAGRAGERANYARRLREADATVLPSGWVVHRAPARTPVHHFSPTRRSGP